MSDSGSTPPRQAIPLRQFRAPRYWGKWLGLAVIWPLAFLPHPLQMRLGKLAGGLGYLLARRRRHICAVNMALCFPELTVAERQRRVRQCFLSCGMGLVEIAITWFRSAQAYRQRFTVSGLEHLEAAQARGRGVLLIGVHFVTLEMAGLLFSLLKPLDATYRPHDNPMTDALIYNGRTRHGPNLIDRNNLRAALRSLRAGNILWYAPDQDYGPKQAVFVPFFGVPAATVSTTARIARAAQAAVILFSHYRTPNASGYHLEFSAPLEDFPSGDDEADAGRVNQLIEAAIRKQPEQYLWLHRRFKTQRDGTAPY